MAGDLRDILNDIRSEQGRLTPAVVVSVAEEESHPLHHRFEWDNNVAGHKWRLHQAGQLLRVKFRQDRGEQDPVSIRAFWPVHTSDNGADSDEGADTSYVPVEEVLGDPVARQVLLNAMRRDWQKFRRRYEHMQEFSQFVTADLNGGNGNDPEQQSA